MKIKDDINIKFAEDLTWREIENEEYEKQLSEMRRKEIVRAIYKTLNILKISQRNKMIFISHWKEGMGVSELAENFKVSKQRISQILQKIAEEIRKKLKEEGAE